MSAFRRTLAAACMFCLFSLVGSSAGAQAADADWPTYNRTLPGDRWKLRRPTRNWECAWCPRTLFLRCRCSSRGLLPT